MSDRELVLRVRCEHGWARDHCDHDESGVHACDLGYCPGGSETVLHPERVLFEIDDETAFMNDPVVRVRDVLDALGGSDE